MYKLNFDKYFKLLNWNVIYIGIKNDIIPADSAIDYANKLVENNILENDSLLIELFILNNAEKKEVLALIDKMTSDEKFNEETSIRILRFLVLDSIEQRNVENRVVLETVESVYVDFNYPEDMNTFISYMPIEDEEYNPSNHTQEDNERRLVEKFNMFLESELKWVNTQFGDGAVSVQ